MAGKLIRSRKWLSVLIVCILLLFVQAAAAEIIYYDDDIDFTLTADRPLALGQETVWTIAVDPSFEAPVEYVFMIALHTEPDDVSYSSKLITEMTSERNQFRFTPLIPGDYSIVAQVSTAGMEAVGLLEEKITLAPAPDYPSLVDVMADIVAQCNAACDTELEKALWLHDYIVNKASYYYVPENFYLQTQQYQHPGAVLVHGLGTCQSYSSAYMMLLSAVGIEADTVSGDNHQWNIVKINNQWTMIDPTWDDDPSGERIYKFFGIPYGANALIIGHRPDMPISDRKGIDLRQCTTFDFWTDFKDKQANITLPECDSEAESKLLAFWTGFMAWDNMMAWNNIVDGKELYLPDDFTLPEGMNAEDALRWGADKLSEYDDWVSVNPVYDPETDQFVYVPVYQLVKYSYEESGGKLYPNRPYIQTSDVADALPDSLQGMSGPLSYSWTKADRKLVITGAGAMPDYRYGNDSSMFHRDTCAPWTFYHEKSGVYRGLDFTSNDIVIGDEVTSIGSEAFINCYPVSAVIGDQVKTIGNNAFSGASHLASVQLGSSLSEIGDGAFADCTDLQELNFPDTLTKIGSRAFLNCQTLSDLHFNDSLAVIGADAFRGCGMLMTLSFGRGLRRIEENAFADCGLVDTISLYPGVEYIGPNAFYRVNKVVFYGTEEEMNAINIDENNPALLSAQWVTAQEDGTCGDGLSWTLTNGVLTISGEGEMVFGLSVHQSPWEGRSDIVRIEIEEGVRSIADNAFSGCKKVTAIRMGSSVTSIGQGAFADCSSLTDVTLSANLTELPPAAFQFDEALTSIVLPEGLTAIGSYAFQHCISLKDVSLPGSLKTIDSYAFYICSSLEQFTVPEGVSFIGDAAFSQTQLKQMTLPSTIESLGAGIFADCSALTSVSLPPDLTVIPEHAFRWCSQLKTLTMPASVTKIDSSAFMGCESLNVLLPAGLRSIGDSALSYTATKQIIFSDALESIGKDFASSCRELETVVFPESIVCSMEELNFSYCDSLKELVIPAGMEIGYLDISTCTSLTSLVVKGKVYDGNFANAGLADVCLPDLDSLEPTENNGKFEGTNIQSYQIPIGITRIGAYTFAYCKRLTSITIPPTVTSIGEYAFHNCLALEKVTIPTTVTEISDNAFSQKVLIQCRRGSYAEQWAQKNGHYLAYLEETTHPNVVIIEMQAPTCVADGYVAYRCAVCGVSCTENGEETKEPVVIPATRIHLTDELFCEGCEQRFDLTAFSTLRLPADILDIQESAFAQTGAAVVELPNAAVMIDQAAFDGCADLKYIVINGQVDINPYPVEIICK